LVVVLKDSSCVDMKMRVKTTTNLQKARNPSNPPEARSTSDFTTRDDNTNTPALRLLHIRPTTHPRNILQLLKVMAAIPATPSRFGSSFSGALQAPYNTDAPSMADSLPSVDFGFNDLRERMTAFTHRFDEFIERGRKRVLEERNAFRMNVAELEGESHCRQQQQTQTHNTSNPRLTNPHQKPNAPAAKPS
jgi:hypothetical protein